MLKIKQWKSPILSRNKQTVETALHCCSPQEYLPFHSTKTNKLRSSFYLQTFPIFVQLWLKGPLVDLLSSKLHFLSKSMYAYRFAEIILVRKLFINVAVVKVKEGEITPSHVLFPYIIECMYSRLHAVVFQLTFSLVSYSAAVTITIWIMNDCVWFKVDRWRAACQTGMRI